MESVPRPSFWIGEGPLEHNLARWRCIPKLALIDAVHRNQRPNPARVVAIADVIIEIHGGVFIMMLRQFQDQPSCAEEPVHGLGVADDSNEATVEIPHPLSANASPEVSVIETITFRERNLAKLRAVGVDVRLRQPLRQFVDFLPRARFQAVSARAGCRVPRIGLTDRLAHTPSLQRPVTVVMLHAHLRCPRFCDCGAAHTRHEPRGWLRVLPRV